jgi:steroid delta-isomerase
VTDIPELLQQYADYISAGDKEGILSLYAPDATCEIPVGGPVHRGIDAIRTFYTQNELAQQVRIVGACCVAGREAAVPMRARIARDGKVLELDVIDVVEVDEQGRFKKLRAFFDLAGARPAAS